jgi:hypothetical protein
LSIFAAETLSDVKPLATGGPLHTAMRGRSAVEPVVAEIWATPDDAHPQPSRIKVAA